MARILMVDDDADFIEIQQMALEGAGHDVTPAYNPSEAMEAIEEATFDLIILDLMMEKSDDGFRLAHEIRSQLGKSVPIMMLTGVRREHDLGFDLDSPAGRKWIEADVFLEKPIPPERLIEEVRRQLQD